MSTMPAIQNDHDLVEIQQAETISQKLMNTKHYAKLGYDGIFAIVQKAKSLNMNPLDALNGGLYFVQGKVEMSAQAMNQLIRNAGHSIQKDDRSNNEICILHGKRKDNGDQWTESFSLAEARAAGLYTPNKPSAWTKYPRDMMFARALSRLARQLFPDVIKNTYVQGEISEAPSFSAPIRIEAEVIPMRIDDDNVKEILGMVKGHSDIHQKLMEFVKKSGGENIEDIEMKDFERVKKAISKLLEEKAEEEEAMQKEYEAQLAEEEMMESAEDLEDKLVEALNAAE